MLTVTPQGPSSYYCAQIAAFGDWIEVHGYTLINSQKNEAGRWKMARSIVILYYNGTILLQGADLDTPRRLLASLIAEQAELPL